MFKRVNTYIRICLIVAFVIIFCNFSNVKAATSSISASSTEVTAGTGVNINVSINAASWNVRVTGAVSDSIVGYDDNASNRTTYRSYSLNTNAPGSYTVSISGDITDQNGSNIPVSSSVTVVVKERPVATNTTQNTSSNTKATNNTSNSNSNSSSNANLSNLVIDQEGLSPMFSSNVTSYTLTVPSKVTSLNITPTVQQAGAKYWIEGDENLEMGENKVTVTVTAPNGTKKTYTINVSRVDDVSKADAALKSLIIDGVELKPEFTPDTLDYDLGLFDSNVEKLTILAFANSDKAKVEIVGNKDFKAGENTIKVIVTAEDGKTKREYNLKFTMEEKKVVEEEQNSYQDVYEEPTRLENFIKNAKKNKLMLIMLLVMIIELLEIIILYRKLHKNDDGNDEISKEIEKEKSEITDLAENAEETKEARRRRGNLKVEEKNDEEVISEELEDKKEENVNDNEPEKENILNLENIEAVKEEVIESQKDEIPQIEASQIQNSYEKNENELEKSEETKIEDEVKEEKKAVENDTVDLPDIDFESLVKETLAKYENEDMKISEEVKDETPKRNSRGKKNT